MTIRKEHDSVVGNSYMDQKRELDRKMREEAIFSTIVLVLVFVLMIVAMRLWG